MEWRICENSNPEENTDCIIYDSTGIVTMARYKSGKYIFYYGLSDSDFIVMTPSHWMPLPEPPKS